MMYRSFTTREKVLMLILAVLMCGLAYYYVIHLPVTTQLTQLTTEKSEIETEMLIAQAKQMQIQNMQSELEELAAAPGGPMAAVPEYDNVQNVMNLLNQTLAGTLDYSVRFQQFDLSAQFVRRVVTLTFTTPDYNQAKATVQTLAAAPYRCQVGNLSIGVSEQGVTTDMTITFFEAQSNYVAPPAVDETAGEEEPAA